MDKCSAYIQKIRGESENTLAFDTGDFLPALPDSERAEYIIRAMKSVGYNAIAVGDQEFLLGELFFKNHFPLWEHFDHLQVGPITLNSVLFDSLFLEANVPAGLALCGNIFDQQDDYPSSGKPVMVSAASASVGSRQVKIYGLMGPSSFLFFPEDKKGWFEIVPWREALVEMLPPVEKDELIILLSHSGLMADREIAEAFPQIDVIIGGHSQSKLENPVKIGKTLIVQADGSGRHVGRLDLKLSENQDIDKFEYELVPMTQDMPSDTAILRIIQDYERAFFADKKPRPHIPVYPDSLAVMSSESCGECHSIQYEQWSGTNHARAFDVIAKQGKTFNPGCLSCHTTGYGHGGGFISAESTPQWKHIQCTECHYCSPGHGESPFLVRSLPTTEATCIRCHSSTNSPDFEYLKYLLKVIH